MENSIKNLYLKIILEKLCSYVNVNYEDVDFSKNNWYWDYQYTKEQSEDFINWLANFMQNSKEARKQLMKVPSKKLTVEFAEQFELNYGWKIKN